MAGLFVAGSLHHRTCSPQPALHRIAPHCTALHRIAPHCTALHRIACIACNDCNDADRPMNADFRGAVLILE
jgi:hypothetical protein